jgi:uncharacterized membrane protein
MNEGLGSKIRSLSMPIKDGFEGAGIIVEILLVLVAVALILPFVTATLSLTSKQKGSATQSVWPSIAVYFASLLMAWIFIRLSLVDQLAKTALTVWAGWLAALISLVLALRARGSGRKVAIAQSGYLLAAWLPFL